LSLLSKEPPRTGGWTSTIWSVVASLEHRTGGAWQSSWAYLAETYRPPMEAYVRRLLGRLQGRAGSAEEACEVVQAFLTTCVEKGWLAKADPAKGRFRAYLQTLLRRYVYGHVERERALKRSPGPGRRVVPLLEGDALEAELPAEEPEDVEAFDRGWVRIALDRARARLALKNERYLMVIDDLILTDGEGSEDLAARVALSPTQLPVLRHRARTQFAKLFQEELAATVVDEVAFRDEWRALQAYLP